MIPLRRLALSSALRQPFVQRQWKPIPSLARSYSISLQSSEYHRLADDTMDKLTTELEDLLEENNLPGSDVEYSVQERLSVLRLPSERSINFEAGKTRNICDQ